MCAGVAVALTVTGMLAAVVEIALTYDVMLRVHRLTAPPWPDIPADSVSMYLAGRVHFWPWFALVWSTGLVYPALRALWRSRDARGVDAPRVPLALLWIPVFVSAVLIASWVLDDVWEFGVHRCAGSYIEDRYWFGGELAYKSLETGRFILHGVIAAALALVAYRGRLWAAAPRASPVSFRVGAVILVLGSLSYLAATPLRADAVDYFRHSDVPGHVHEPLLSVEDDRGERLFVPLERCEAVTPSDACWLHRRNENTVALEEVTGREPDYAECANSGLFVRAEPDTPMPEIVAALDHAASRGITRVRLLDVRVTAVTRQTTSRIVTSSYCGRALELVRDAPLVSMTGTLGEFVARVERQEGALRFSLPADVSVPAAPW